MLINATMTIMKKISVGNTGPSSKYGLNTKNARYVKKQIENTAANFIKCEGAGDWLEFTFWRCCMQKKRIWSARLIIGTIATNSGLVIISNMTFSPKLKIYYRKINLLSGIIEMQYTTVNYNKGDWIRASAWRWIHALAAHRFRNLLFRAQHFD